ncbi:hypothetical protein RRG08_060097 [Elysia crispata]|uniref:Uncharacterized protein n=1 Tax=Elysia crispata TaxID=231223 RepID=A0AAE1E099_9GAST|nr:hypothetical protein RRG08_060097 [Elysia crispata]
MCLARESAAWNKHCIQQEHLEPPNDVPSQGVGGMEQTLAAQQEHLAANDVSSQGVGGMEQTLYPTGVDGCALEYLVRSELSQVCSLLHKHDGSGPEEGNTDKQIREIWRVRGEPDMRHSHLSPPRASTRCTLYHTARFGGNAQVISSYRGRHANLP